MLKGNSFIDVNMQHKSQNECARNTLIEIAFSKDYCVACAHLHL